MSNLITEREKKNAYMREWNKANPDKVKAIEERRKEKKRQTAKEWNKNHREKLNQIARDYRKKHREEMRQRGKERYQKHGKKWAKDHKEKILQVKRKRLYGLMPYQYEQMVIQQGNKCGICEKSFIDKRSTPHVDHDHETGNIRGLLCSKCNLGLGQIGLFLNNAIKYIENNK
jgi:hypothetical protein